MQLSLHLCFGGQCEAAFKFYQRSLGGSIHLLSYGNSPAAAQVPSEWREKIVHANLTVGDMILAGADVLPAQYARPQGFYVLLSVATLADARLVFDTLSEGGVIRMPLQETFWSPSFGVFVDQFGIPWEISCEQAPSVA